MQVQVVLAVAVGAQQVAMLLFMAVVVVESAFTDKVAAVL